MLMEEGGGTGGGTPSPRSPEAKLGMQVEDLWDIQEPQLSPTEKLNACFESIPVSDFPLADPSQVTEINSDSSLAEVVRLLAEHKVLSAPVVDVEAADDASWIDRYIGMIEFAGIVVWILHQSEKMEGSEGSSPESVKDSEDAFGRAVAAASSGMSSPRYRSLHPESPTATSGNFFETLTSSSFYKNTKVRDISGSFRWAPFLALQKSNSFLTMLLLLSKYRMKSIPVVDLGEQKIDNIITQSAVIHMLEECAGLHWFESWGSKKLYELGLPLMKASHIVKVYEDEPVLQAFKLMRLKGVGGVPVVESGGRKAVGNISIRDVQFLLLAPEIYKDFRSITAMNLGDGISFFLYWCKRSYRAVLVSICWNSSFNFVCFCLNRNFEQGGKGQVSMKSVGRQKRKAPQNLKENNEQTCGMHKKSAGRSRKPLSEAAGALSVLRGQRIQCPAPCSSDQTVLDQGNFLIESACDGKVKIPPRQLHFYTLKNINRTLLY